jgi:hypothetical protein
MNDEVVSDVYKIKRFSKADDKDFIKALSIYSKYTPSNIKTNTNDISYWLDKYNKKFKDEFFVFGLYSNNNVIAYMQLVYFKNEKFITIDYITIDKNYRQLHMLSNFIHLVNSFFEQENYDVNFVVAEIEYDDKIKQPLENGKSLIRLLKQYGFGVVKAKYFQPQLGIYNFDSRTSAILMYYSKDEKKYISKEKYLMILNKLYYEHYCRWYEPLLTNEEYKLYQDDINDIYEKLTNGKIQERININGYKHIFSTSSNIEKAPIKNTFFSSLIIFLLLFSLLALQEFFNVSLFSLTSLSLLVTALFFLIFSLYSDKGLEQFDKVKKLLKLWKN